MRVQLWVVIVFIVAFAFTSAFALLEWEVAMWIGVGFLIVSIMTEAIIIAVNTFKHFKK